MCIQFDTDFLLLQGFAKGPFAVRDVDKQDLFRPHGFTAPLK
jgi:hypothetical protein